MSDETIEPPTDSDHDDERSDAHSRGPSPTDTPPDEDPLETPADAIDLDAIERDFDGVQLALGRLADGTYWTDEVTGAPIAPETLAADPLARQA